MNSTGSPARSPVQARVWDAIVAQMTHGQVLPGQRLGSERELAERYAVSRGTLRQVLSMLESAGLVSRQIGRGGGIFAARPKVERDLTEVSSLPTYLRRQGYSADSRILSTQIVRADAAARTALRLSAEDAVIAIRRVRLADGSPISLEQALFPADRFGELMELPLSGSIYELLAQHFGVGARTAEETIEVVAATDEEAGILAIGTGDPLLAITRTAYDVNGQPFEFSQDLFRADMTRLVVRSQQGGEKSPSARTAPSGLEVVRSAPEQASTVPKH